MLDTRNKMVVTEFAFHRICSDLECESKIHQIKQTLPEITNIYATKQTSFGTQRDTHHGTRQSDLAQSSSSACTSLDRKHKTRGRSEVDDFVRSNEIILPIKNKLEIYLEDGVVKFDLGPDYTFHALT